MDRYIGLDAHASSCTLAVVSPSGKRVGTQVVETNARCLIEAVRESRGAKDDRRDAFGLADALRTPHRSERAFW
jgi:hypothetical protein